MLKVEYHSHETDPLGETVLQVEARSAKTQGYSAVQFLLAQELGIAAESLVVTAEVTTGRLKVVVSFTHRPGGMSDNALRKEIETQVMRVLNGRF